MANSKIKYYFLWLSLIFITAFILQLLIPGFTDFFVLNSKSVYLNEYWRFLTAIFLHGSFMHLFYNLFALLFFGFALEKLIGSNRFIVVFFGSGIIANLIAVNFYSSSLGASGAIYGIIGCLTILSPLMMVWAFGLIMPMFIAAILWVIGDILGIFIPRGIGNIAHLSGIAVGFFLGILYRIFKNKRTREFRKEKLIFPENYMRRWENAYVR